MHLLAAGARAQEVARGFGGEAGGFGDIDGRWLSALVMIATAGVVLAVARDRFRRWRAARAAGSARVLRDLSRHLGLTRGQRRRLRRAAGEIAVEHAATLLVCPTLLLKARHQSPAQTRGELDRVLLRA